jgi:hypothetical protein
VAFVLALVARDTQLVLAIYVGFRVVGPGDFVFDILPVPFLCVILGLVRGGDLLVFARMFDDAFHVLPADALRRGSLSYAFRFIIIVFVVTVVIIIIVVVVIGVFLLRVPDRALFVLVFATERSLASRWEFAFWRREMWAWFGGIFCF